MSQDSSPEPVGAGCGYAFAGAGRSSGVGSLVRLGVFTSTTTSGAEGAIASVWQRCGLGSCAGPSPGGRCISNAGVLSLRTEFLTASNCWRSSSSMTLMDTTRGTPRLRAGTAGGTATSWATTGLGSSSLEMSSSMILAC